MASLIDAPKQLNKRLNPVSGSVPLSSMKKRVLAIGTGPPARLDTVIGPNHKGVLVTITERSSNYLLMKRVDDKSAGQTRKAIITCLQERGLPVHTLTSDNGTEFAHYEQVAKVLNANFYFAHPYHAWERGANEHNNKLIRQYIPKKKDFSQMSHQEVKTYQERINDRPRKKLNYSTPNEHLKSIFSAPFVAFQT